MKLFQSKFCITSDNQIFNIILKNLNKHKLIKNPVHMYFQEEIQRTVPQGIYISVPDTTIYNQFVGDYGKLRTQKAMQ